MLDMFGRRINEGDIIIHVGRQSSTTTTHIAQVLSVANFSVRVRVIAGNTHEWTYGDSDWDGQVYRRIIHEGSETTYKASGLIMVSNGIDALGIHDDLIERQRQNISWLKSQQ